MKQQVIKKAKLFGGFRLLIVVKLTTVRRGRFRLDNQSSLRFIFPPISVQLDRGGMFLILIGPEICIIDGYQRQGMLTLNKILKRIHDVPGKHL
jgi:hypothetical protein